MIFSDRSLSQKLELTEARASAAYTEARAEVSPESGAEWTEIAGAYAMFDGRDSPITQTFGLGMFDEITDTELDTLEAFFVKHDAPVFHEVSPLAGLPLVNLLGSRGYRPIELTSVMFQPLEAENGSAAPLASEIKTRVIGADEEDSWARTAADGWATEGEGLADFMFNFGRISARARGGFPFRYI